AAARAAGDGLHRRDRAPPDRRAAEGARLTRASGRGQESAPLAMSRNHRRRWLLAIVVVLAVVIAATLVALPEIVRRVAVARLTTTTGRAVIIDDIDLNLFTGRVVVK